MAALIFFPSDAPPGWVMRVPPGILPRLARLINAGRWRLPPHWHDRLAAEFALDGRPTLRARVQGPYLIVVADPPLDRLPRRPAGPPEPAGQSAALNAISEGGMVTRAAQMAERSRAWVHDLLSRLYRKGWERRGRSGG
jgi:hypothetical protein